MGQTRKTLLLALISVAFTSGCAHRHYLPLAINTPPTVTSPIESYARILRTYVSDEGDVNFTALRDDRPDLDNFVSYIAHTNPDVSPKLYNDRETRLAFYINAYNALCMYNVIYSGVIPKNRIRFFISQQFKIDGKFMSLLNFENDIIRKFDEPRIHFAINCMSRSCPRLRNRPFLKNILDAQLHDATVEFLNDPRHTKIDHVNQTVYYSRILKWFKKDFLSVSPTLTQYVNQYRQDNIPEDYKVKFLNYDWTLIDANQPQ